MLVRYNNLQTKWLYHCEFASNPRFYSIIGYNPVFALYGQDCKASMTYSIMNTRFESGNHMVQEYERSNCNC